MRIRSPVPRKKSRIEIIPLIDIMFFLLASFMMVSLQMQKVQTVKASLPTATLARPNVKPDMVNISVDKFGRVAVDKKEMSLLELQGFLTNKFQANTNIPVYITGHKEASHGTMIFVLDFVKRTGIQKVAFAVKATESPGARP
jgi:biopolymer transport protein ExbD